MALAFTPIDRAHRRKRANQASDKSTFMRTPKFFIPRWCALMLICMCAAPASFGQQPSKISGLRVTVADANQRPVPGALCSLLRDGDATRTVATATTDGQGVAVFSSVAPGTYTLRVEREGFDAYNKGGLLVKEDSAGEVAVAEPAEAGEPGEARDADSAKHPLPCRDACAAGFR